MAKLKNNNGQLLEQVDLGGLPHSSWYDGFSVKGTMNLGTLVPSRVRETLPADTISCGGSSYSIQFQPLAVPTLDNLYHTHDTFKVPYRILWDNWDKFWSKGEDLKYVNTPPSFSIVTILDAVFNSGIFGNFKRVNIKKIRPNSTPLGQLTQVYNVTVQPNANLYLPLFFNLNGSEIPQMRLNVIEKATQYGMLDLIDNLLDAFDTFVDWYEDNKVYYLESDEDDNAVMSKHGILLNKLMLVQDNLYAVEPYIPTLFSGEELSSLSFPLDNNDVLLHKLINTDEFYEQSPLLQRSCTLIEGIFKDRIGDFGDVTDLIRQFNTYMPKFDIVNLTSLIDNMYAILRPVIGYGSVFDYLGYGAYKKDDLFVALYYRFSESIADDYGESAIYFDEDDFSSKKINGLKLRAYYSIWYWNYRDILIETLAPEPRKTDLIDGEELFWLIFMRFRCWEKDTFTTALANTGEGSVVVPTQNVVDVDETKQVAFNDFYNPLSKDPSTVATIGADIKSFTLRDGTTLEFPTRFLMGHHDTIDGRVGSNALDTGGFSLDMFDRARAVQKWLSKALIYGNRPEDALYTRWRVKYSDVRLQLPEHIVRGTSLVRIDTLVNNTTTEVSNAGDKTANMFMSSENQGKFKEYFEEHGVLITLQSIIPNSDYGYGTSRSSYRFDAFDYPDSDFAQLGFDAVYTDELVSSHVSDNIASVQGMEKIKNSVLGYQRRYYDFVTKHNEIHGELLDTMDRYTFARKFSAYNKDEFPQLTPRFVHCHPRTEMFVYDPKKVDLCWFDCYHEEKVNRALPMFSKVF